MPSRPLAWLLVNRTSAIIFNLRRAITEIHGNRCEDICLLCGGRTLPRVMFSPKWSNFAQPAVNAAAATFWPHIKFHVPCGNKTQDKRTHTSAPFNGIAAERKGKVVPPKMARPKHIRERNWSESLRAKLFYACNNAEKKLKVLEARRKAGAFCARWAARVKPSFKVGPARCFLLQNERSSDGNPFMRNPKSRKIHTKTSDACHTANFEHKGFSVAWEKQPRKLGALHTKAMRKRTLLWTWFARTFPTGRASDGRKAYSINRVC